MAEYARLNTPNPESHRRAKELRRASPLAEQIMWHRLRLETKNKNFRFRRQYPIDPYIVDFACIKHRLLIEIDGMSHDMQVEFDKRRDDYLKSLGYEVMRFTNEDVFANSDGVIQSIFSRIKELAVVTPLP
jgi:very-short-patch-repair endonuclease